MSLGRIPSKPTLFSFRLFAPSKVTEGRSLRRMIVGSVLALVGLLSFPLLFFGLSPLSVNVSESLPVGLYWTGSLPQPGIAPGETMSGGRGGNLGVEVGMIVLACLPPEVATSALERGYLPEGTCPSGITPVGKVIAALPGDTVDVTDSGSLVNGVLLPNSAPLLHDSKGRMMPRLRGRFVLPAETTWLYSGHSRRSFDSRYYGPVSLSGVHGQLFPLLTRGDAYRPFPRVIPKGSGGPRAEAKPEAVKP